MKGLWSAGLLASLFVTACGGGLSHTIDEVAVRGVVGPQAVKLEEARGRISQAQAAHKASVEAAAASDKLADKAEQAVESAEAKVDAAEGALERSDSTFEESERAAKATYERRVTEAKGVYDAAVTKAKKAYDTTVAVAAGKHSAERTSGQRALAEAERAQALEEATEAYRRALHAESEARREVDAADLWVAKAEYELAKFEALVVTNSRKGPDVTEERISFSEQLAEKQAALRDKQLVLAEKERDTARAKAALEKLSPQAPAPAPTPTPTPASD